MKAVVQRSDPCHSCAFAMYKLDQDYWGECERETSFLDPMLRAGRGCGGGASL